MANCKATKEICSRATSKYVLQIITNSFKMSDTLDNLGSILFYHLEPSKVPLLRKPVSNWMGTIFEAQ